MSRMNQKLFEEYKVGEIPNELNRKGQFLTEQDWIRLEIISGFPAAMLEDHLASPRQRMLFLLLLLKEFGIDALMDHGPTSMWQEALEARFV